MRQFFPVEELARDERFVQINMAERMKDARTALDDQGVVGQEPRRLQAPHARSPRRLRRRPGADARHLRRRDPGARGRRSHLLTTSPPATAPTTRSRSSSSSTWPARPGTRRATSRSASSCPTGWAPRLGEFAENTVLFEAACSQRPDPAPRRRQPGPRGPGHRRVHHDEGVRRHRRRPVPRVLRGLDARRRGHPREDGLRLAAQGHRERSRAAQPRRSSSSRWSTSCSASAAPAARATRVPIGLARRFRELAGFTDDEVDTISQMDTTRSRSVVPSVHRLPREGRRRSRPAVTAAA